MADLRPVARLPLLALGMASLLCGVAAGLARLAWDVHALAVTAVPWHGALMISGFLGTVISLERAVAIGRRWAYLAPAAAAISGVAALAGAPIVAAQILSIAAAAGLTVASIQILRRQFAPFTVTLAIAACCWLIGNLAWLGSGTLTTGVPWWLSFLVLTISGERLELTRLIPTPPAAQRLFFLIVGAILGGAALGLHLEGAGGMLFAAGLTALAAWLLRYDIARRNVRQQGLTRFVAVCLLAGYVWLALAGLLGLTGALQLGHPWRDAMLHAVGLGFVFSMILGHAPIIFPAVARVAIPYHPAFYLPLAMLHASLALRVGGSIVDDFALRRMGGLLNAVALLLFVITILTSVVRGKRVRSPLAGRTA